MTDSAPGKQFNEDELLFPGNGDSLKDKFGSLEFEDFPDEHVIYDTVDTDVMMSSDSSGVMSGVTSCATSGATVPSPDDVRERDADVMLPNTFSDRRIKSAVVMTKQTFC